MGVKGSCVWEGGDRIVGRQARLAKLKDEQTWRKQALEKSTVAVCSRWEHPSELFNRRSDGSIPPGRATAPSESWPTSASSLKLSAHISAW